MVLRSRVNGFVVALKGAGCSAADPISAPTEDWVLERLVEILGEQESIVHVDPRTLGWQDEFGWWHETEEGTDALWAGHLRRWSAELSTEGCDARAMLLQLHALNATTRTWEPSATRPARLVLDEGRTHDAYFEPGGGGWQRWYQEHPGSAGYLRVSRPVIDARHGFVLLLGDFGFDMLAGYAWLGLYRIDEHGLEKLREVVISVS